MDYRDFIFWESTSRDTIDFKKVYVDISGDLIAGLLLSQIVYWHLPSKDDGHSKLQVEHEDHLWIAKGRDDWYDEIRITNKQFDRAVKILVSKGIVEKKLFKFNGDPMVHVRLVWDRFLDLMNAQNQSEPLGDMVFTQRGKRDLPKGEKGNRPKGKKDFDQRAISSYTENTHIEDHIEHPIEHSQSVSQLVKQIASKVWSNIPPERLTDIIACYVCFNDVLTGGDLLRILNKVKDRQTNQQKNASSGKIKDFKKYLWSCMEDAIKPSETAQIEPKEPVRKEILPEWFEESREERTGVRMDDADYEIKQKRIKDRLEKLRSEDGLTDEERRKKAEIEEILREFRNK